ncbi:hypothetical protein [Streptomyces gilvosporeus]|uniref:Uncharacterized protein n=1 Tax=Streptomyces gilvosporeus TaxID=553510 RepID=A0A1V0TJX5_9ACTN|nr:hypothetical protein [Streptomyces gilvosporeus]ARF53247.1 hypothetical protein B1H19_02875 [Streptomyces gilvosporeus]
MTTEPKTAGPPPVAAAAPTAAPDLDVTFLDHLRPRATAGPYRVTVEQVLKGSDGQTLNPGDPLTAEHSFEIRAPQFVLDAASVHAFYPAPGAAGDFTRTLPHVTLTRAPLPWERDQRWSRADRRAPWMALLLFRAGELPDDPEGLAHTTKRTVAKLVTPDEPGVLGPALTGLPPETLSSDCHTIDVPAALFNALVPREEEMYYLAHVRDVRPAALRDDGETFTEGTFGVLTGNRFPVTTGDYAAHLVSFEGFDGRLEGELPPGTEFVRLASLWAWSFRCDTKAAFDAQGILQKLVAPGHDDPEDLALRLPPGTDPPSDPDDAQQLALERLRRGFVPVAHRVLSGERTYGWYRGPATPVTAPEVPPVVGERGTHTSADHALIYEAEHGLFDVSYAAAWTLGRAVGLADPQYAAETVRARRQLANAAAQLMARGGARGAGPSELATGRRSLRALHELARERGGRSLAEALAAPQIPSRPATDDDADVRERGPRVSRAEARAAAHALLADEDGQAVLRATAERTTGSLPQWLDQLTLLRGVPFPYLVPDARMLPPESLRLFRIDPAWLAALTAGAHDVGVHTSLDHRLAPALREAAAGRSAVAPPAAGLLIRSALVPAWPQIRVTAYRKGAALTELRRDHPDHDVLLCLFDGVPDELVLREPSQGIRFGIDSGDLINLRQLAAGGDPELGASLPGRRFPSGGSSTVFTAYLRDGGAGGPAGVLRLLDGDGREGLVTGLAREFGLDSLRPSQLAVELINSPIEQRLTVPPAAQ